MKAFATIPEKISYDNKKLFFEWRDGHQSEWVLLKLRKVCPCAVCRGGDFGKIGTMTTNITTAAISSYNVVGRYAINILWQDGHNIGIYSYNKLRESCECKECLVKNT